MNKNIADNLTWLLSIQEIDTHLDGILKLRGTLPDEVNKLVQEIEKGSTEMSERIAMLDTLDKDIMSNREFIKQTECKVLKYESQQMEVRNNREYDAITNELELHKLDIQLANRCLSTAYEKVAQEKAAIQALKQYLERKEADLCLKQKELEVILQETQKEENSLHSKRAEIIASIDSPLYLAYEKIRANVTNNLAVASIKKSACEGCCIVIPTHQRLSVYERNKIVFCEYCGRMLIASNEAADTGPILSITA